MDRPQKTYDRLGELTMNTILNRAASALLVGLLPAGMLAAAQVRVETPPGTGGAVNVQAGPANVQTGPGGANVAVPPGTAAAIQDNAAARQENRIERREDRRTAVANNNDWRMQRYNNRWWYWHPNSTWSYHNGTAWVPYNAPNRSYTAAQPGPVRTRRYSSGYRGNMIQNLAPAVNPNTNVLPGNQPAINNAPNRGLGRPKSGRPPSGPDG